MIDLAPLQRDALIEIGNVGMSKAAKQLSTLLSSRIEISIPEINLSHVDKIDHDSLFPTNDILSYVYQVLSGEIDGRAVLIFQRKHTTLLTKLVIGQAPKLSEKEIRACEQEAMLEIGNIIITSCICAIINMLSSEVKLSVPKYGEDKIVHLIESQVKEIEGSSNDVILIETKLDASGQDISGKLLIMMTAKSIERLYARLDTLLKG